MKVKLIANNEFDTDLSSVMGEVFEAVAFYEGGACEIPISEFKNYGITFLEGDVSPDEVWVFFLPNEVEVLG